MMPPVLETLAADSNTLALLGSNVWRHDDAPQDVLPPYATWFVSAAPENSLSEIPGIDRATVTVNIYSADDAEVVTIATAVRDAIEPFAHLINTPVDNRDRGGTKLYRIALQFDWWIPRNP